MDNYIGPTYLYRGCFHSFDGSQGSSSMATPRHMAFV